MTLPAWMTKDGVGGGDPAMAAMPQMPGGLNGADASQNREKYVFECVVLPQVVVVFGLVVDPLGGHLISILLTQPGRCFPSVVGAHLVDCPVAFVLLVVSVGAEHLVPFVFFTSHIRILKCFWVSSMYWDWLHKSTPNHTFLKTYESSILLCTGHHHLSWCLCGAGWMLASAIVLVPNSLSDPSIHSDGY